MELRLFLEHFGGFAGRVPLPARRTLPEICSRSATIVEGLVTWFVQRIVAVKPHLPTMKTTLVGVGLLILASFISLHAQEPVLIGGGATRPQPVMEYTPPPAPAVPVAQHVRIRYEYEASSVPITAGNCAPRPAYDSSYTSYPTYPRYSSYSAPGCAPPTVIYFGRGEAARRGYAFRSRR